MSLTSTSSGPARRRSVRPGPAPGGLEVVDGHGDAGPPAASTSSAVSSMVSGRSFSDPARGCSGRCSTRWRPPRRAGRRCRAGAAGGAGDEGDPALERPWAHTPTSPASVRAGDPARPPHRGQHQGAAGQLRRTERLPKGHGQHHGDQRFERRQDRRHGGAHPARPAKNSTIAATVDTTASAPASQPARPTRDRAAGAQPAGRSTRPPRRCTPACPAPAGPRCDQPSEIRM